MTVNNLIFAGAVFSAAIFTAPLITAQQESATQEPKTIEVIAKKFAFEPSRIEVVEGERVRLVVHSADSPHGIEIEKFNVNKMVPRGGEKVTIDFVASAPGTYPIACSEYCGDGHEDMKGTLIVQAKPK